MYPISDLTAFCRRTTGDVPPKLVGASTTVVGSKMYLYGGRLVAERKMVSDIYVFCLQALKWEKLPQASDENVPQARYFHSADTWNNHLVIFGGMAIQPLSDNPEDLCVLNDVRLFDLATNKWTPAPHNSPSPLVPKARYAHLSSITSNRLFIIGGQDLNNVWLDDIHVYDLLSRKWVQRRDYPRHCGTYRSVAVTATKRVRLPQEEGRRSSQPNQAGTRFSVDKNAPPAPDVTSSDSLTHLPYSTDPTDEYPCDVFLFSNYNFTDVQRELEIFSPLPGSDFTVSDRSASMTGAFFPPGLRFPTGAILGTHFIVAGTYLSQTFQSFSIWALDLVTMTWSRIDPGSTLSGTSGSWFRSCLWPEENKFLVFGNRHGNLVEDYNRRLLSWDHVISIDLEAFGVYQPPPLVLPLPQQELGLAALEEGILADFEIICDDGRKIKCSRKVLEDRWPWFYEQRRLFLDAAARAIAAIPSADPPSPLPEFPNGREREKQPDPRLSPRSLHLSEPYPVTLAFLQYLYSMSLITPLQHAPAVLSQLLLLSSTYELPHLQSLVKHAMHRALSFATSVGIYGVATLCNCRSLQIRALRVVMAYSQKRPNAGRSRDKDGSGAGGTGGTGGAGGAGGSRPNDSGGGAGPGPGFGSPIDKPFAARPRGMSDASYMRGPTDSSNVRVFSNGTVDLRTVMSESDLAVLLAQLPPGPFYIGHRSTDYLSSNCTTATSNPTSPVSAFLPSSSPAQSIMRRPRPSTLPASIPGQNSIPSSSKLPPPIQTEQIQFSAQSTSSAPSLQVRSDLTRRGSIVSISTEQDILDLADLLSPTIDVDDDDISVAQLATAQVFPDVRRASTSTYSMPHRFSVDSHMTSSSVISSVSSPSVDSLTFDDQRSEDYCESAYLSPSSTSFTPFHLPHLRRHRYRSDTPSLTNSDAHSTISIPTPPLSRTSSFQQGLMTPPVSPLSLSYQPTIIEASIAGLDVIHERRNSEDADVVIKSEQLGSSFEDANMGSTSEHQSAMWERRAVQELGKLRIQTESPETIVPSGPASSVSSGDTASNHGLNTPQHRSSALSRLFQKNAKSTDRITDPNSSTLDLKLQKAEEKRRKKQLAKERTERLAQDLKQRAKSRGAAEETRSIRSAGGSSDGKKQNPAWEEEGGMYNGLGW